MLHCGEIHPTEELSLHIVATDTAVRRIEFGSHETSDSHNCVPDAASPVVAEAIRQLNAYFEGRLREFDLPLEADGTGFQKQVWQALREIPYGATCSYGDVARQIGSPRAVRAVGAANGRNPLPIVVPCHRVIASNGKLQGFGGGLKTKQYLLDLEHADRPR